MKYQIIGVTLLFAVLGCKTNKASIDPYSRLNALKEHTSVELEFVGLEVEIDIIDSLPLAYQISIINNCKEFDNCLLIHNQQISFTDPDGNIYHLPEYKSLECPDQFLVSESNESTIQFYGALLCRKMQDGPIDGIYTVKNSCSIDSCYYKITSQFYYDKKSFYQLGYNLGY